MNRPLTVIGLIIAVLVAVFTLTGLFSGYLVAMLAIGVVFIGIGAITGQ